MHTFLFTDIEGSTRLWERYPAAMGAAIARHERILRDAIEVCGGVVFNTAGDSVCAVFATPSQAVAAAIAAQRLLLAEPWDAFAPGLRISVRMGIDTGEAHTAGKNYLGPALNQLHRLMRVGHGGQILCGPSIVDDGNLDPDCALRDLGSHSLRDVAADIRIFQVVAPGLPDTFPNLATEQIAAPPLPYHPHALFGREEELDRLYARLTDPKVRMLTLLGPGGVGKTTLAIALLERIQPAARLRPVFIDLSAMRDAAQVIPAIATAIDAVDPLLAPEEAVIARLKQLHLLLVLDNCEQVVDGVAQIVARILRATETVKVLATSRIPLRIRGEWEAHVEPLPLPEVGDRSGANPAVRLFVDHARYQNDRFALDASTEPAVVDICRMVDGLPLAIELAAAWVRLLDPATLRNRLAEGAPLLRSDERDRPERHRTLTSTIDWSYQLLPASGRAAFGRLAVFQGGIPLDGALAVLQDGDRATFIEALDQLDLLVQANLLQLPAQTFDGPRYHMLQTLQEFALNALSIEDRLAAETAHADYFASMASGAQAHYRGPQAALWLDRLDANIENVRAALLWLAAPDRASGTPALLMATELFEFFDVRNRIHDARQFLALAIEAAPAAPGELRARALAQLGNTWLSNYEQAETFFRRSLAIAAEDPENDWQMTAALGLHSVALMRGDVATALAMAHDVVSRMRASADPAALAQALLVLGHTLEWTGRFAEALAPLDESIVLSEQIGDIAGVAWARRIQGLALLALDRTVQSEAQFRTAMTEFEQVGEHVMIGFCQLDLARMVLHTHQTAQTAALDLIAQAIEVILPVADVFVATSMLDIGARLLVHMDDPAGAVALLCAAERWRTTTGTVCSVAMQHEIALTRADATSMLDTTTERVACRRGHSHSLRDALLDLQDRIHALQAADRSAQHARPRNDHPIQQRTESGVQHG